MHCFCKNKYDKKQKKIEKTDYGFFCILFSYNKKIIFSNVSVYISTIS